MNDEKPDFFFTFVTSAALGAIVWYAWRKMGPDQSKAAADTVGSALGLKGNTGFEPALAGITVAAAAGGLPGLVDAFGNAVNPKE